MKKQYIVQSNSINEKKKFYNHLINKGYKPIKNIEQQKIINSHFPFVIEQDNFFWICESITCCAAATSCSAIITIDKYLDIIKNNNDKLD